MDVTTGRRAVGALAVAGVAVLVRPGTHANHMIRQQVEALRRHLRRAGGRLEGVRYQLAGRGPDPDVDDGVLADRIRSSLGPVEKRLDVPRVHVMVEDHVALLHGAVGSEEEADAVEQAALAVPGVAGVESYLHIGLGAGDTRPSEGRRVHQPSDAHRALVDAATAAGVAPADAPNLVRGVLSAVADRLPEAERAHVALHLPADVRALFTPPRRARRAAAPRTVADLVGRIGETAGALPPDAEAVVARIVTALRDLVPEEAADVAAVLPGELRELWLRPVGDAGRPT